jgi:hypothetical protein
MEAQKNLARCAGIFQIFGPLYFSVQTKSKKKIRKYFYTLYFVFIFILLFIQSLIFGVMVGNEMPETLSARNALNYIMYYFLFVCLVLVICTSLTQSFFTTGKLKKIFKNFLKISQLFQKEFCVAFDYNEVKSKIFRLVFVMGILHILSLVSNVVFGLFNRHFSTFLQVFIGSFPLAFIDMTIIKYIFFVIAINVQLNHIKNILEKILMRRSFRDVNQILSKKSKPKISFEVKIKNLLKIYNIIYENSRLVNESMGLTILVMIFVVVVAMIGGGYKIFLVLVGKFDTEKAGGIIVSVIFSACTLFLMVYICNASEKLVSK